MKLRVFIFLIIFIIGLYCQYALFADMYLEIGPSYSVYNNTSSINVLDYGEVTLENGEKEQFSDGDYSAYKIDYGNTSIISHPSINLYGRFGNTIKDSKGQGFYDTNVGIGLYTNLAYDKNGKKWISYKLDFGPEIFIDNDMAGISLKPVLSVRRYSSDNVSVGTYHVNEAEKKIDPEFQKVSKAYSCGVGLGLMLYSGIWPYVNSRLFCDVGFSFWGDYKSDYTSMLETFVKIGALYCFI